MNKGDTGTTTPAGSPQIGMESGDKEADNTKPQPPPKGGGLTTYKQPGWLRAVNILLRTGHIGTAGIFFGGSVFAVSFTLLADWHLLLILTGCGLLALEILHDLQWYHRGKGLIGLVHLSLAIGIHFQRDWTVPLLWAILVTGCIGSHMPRSFRYWSMLHGKEVRGDSRSA